MHYPKLIVQGSFGYYYRLHRGWFIDAPVEPEQFTDDYFAEQFVRDLRVDADDWIHILYEIDGKPRNTYNHNVYQDLAALIVRGDINVYRVTHLDPFSRNHAARGLDYPILTDSQGASYHFVPASLFLTHRLENARFFKRDADAAKRFLDNLNLTDKQIQDIADSMRFFWWTRPRGGSTPKSLRWHLRHALEQGEIGVVKEAPAPAPAPRPVEPDLVLATGPGNRPVTLGPHDGQTGVAVKPVAGPSTGEQVASTALDVIPVVGSLKSAGQVLTGADLVTGEPVHRGMEAVGILAGMVPGGKAALKGGSKLSSFIGKLRGKPVSLPGVKTQTIQYTKRNGEELVRLRNEFNAKGRSDFLKELSTDPNKVPVLKKAGLTDEDLKLMEQGTSPRGWEAHHKIPLDDGGTNASSNLTLLRKEPDHKVFTNAQRELVGNLKPGESKTVDFPVPEGFVYSSAL